jgi:glycosyltransferase involved in cell wall biosynthesis
MSAAAFGRAGVPREKIRVVYNGVSMEQLEPRLSREEARRQLDLPRDPPIVVYAGHVKPKKGLETLAAVATATPSMQHVWVGGDDDGSPAWGERCAADAGAGNITVTGWLTAPEVSPYLHAADALVIPPTSGPLTRHGNTVLPMKVFSYLGVGRPILAPRLPDLEELLTHDENAWLVEEDSVAAARAGLERITGDTERAERLGTAALHTAQELTWDARAQKIHAFIEERLEASR